MASFFGSEIRIERLKNCLGRGKKPSHSLHQLLQVHLVGSSFSLEFQQLLIYFQEGKMIYHHLSTLFNLLLLLIIFTV